MVFIEKESFSGESRYKQGVDDINIKVQKEIEYIHILTSNYDKAKKVLRNNWSKVYEKENLDVKDIQYIIDRK